MRRADNVTVFMCRFSWNLGASTSWKPQGLFKRVQGLLYLYVTSFSCETWCRVVWYVKAHISEEFVQSVFEIQMVFDIEQLDEAFFWKFDIYPTKLHEIRTPEFLLFFRRNLFKTHFLNFVECAPTTSSVLRLTLKQSLLYWTPQ